MVMVRITAMPIIPGKNKCPGSRRNKRGDEK